jgi:hypothetical protein
MRFLREASLTSGGFKRKVKKKKNTEKEFVTFISSRTLLGRRDQRGNLGHQSNIQRIESMSFLQVGILNILWQEEGGWREMGSRLDVWERGWGRCWTLVVRSLGLGRYVCSSSSMICIVSVFPDIPAFQNL